MNTILKVVGGIVLGLIGIAMVLFAYLAVRPDIPPLDESMLTPNRAAVPDDRNGYLIIEKAADAAPDTMERRKRYVEPKDRRMPTADEVKSASDTFGASIALVEKAVEYDEFLAPSAMEEKELLYRKMTPEEEGMYKRRANIIRIRYVVRAMLTLAWDDLRNGRNDEAQRKIISAYKVSRAMQIAGGGIMQPMLGESFMSAVLEEADAMIDEKLMPQEMYPALLSLLSERPGYVMAGIKESWKEEYLGNRRIVDDARLTAGGYARYVVKPRRNQKPIYDGYRALLKNCDLPFNKWRRSGPDPKMFNSPVELFVNELKNGNSTGLILAAIGMPNFEHAVRKAFIADMKLNAMRLKLAALIYKEKNGKLPETLSVLVPEYIKSVPADPIDGGALRYNPARGVIYSIGFDLKDHGGRNRQNIFEQIKTGHENEPIDEKTDLVLNIVQSGRHTPLAGESGPRVSRPRPRPKAAR